MRAGSAPLFPLAIAALLAALTYWLEHAVQFDTGHATRHRHDPDFIVENFTLRHFGPDGALQNSGVAQKMVHYGDDDSTEITTPAFTFYGTPPMLLTADRAWMGKDGKEVRLEGNVRAVRQATADTPESVVTTSVMYIYPDDEIAHSDVPTTLTQGRSVLSGGGFDADNKRKLLVLARPVRGTIYRDDAHLPTGRP